MEREEEEEDGEIEADAGEQDGEMKVLRDFTSPAVELLHSCCPKCHSLARLIGRALIETTSCVRKVQH